MNFTRSCQKTSTTRKNIDMTSILNGMPLATIYNSLLQILVPTYKLIMLLKKGCGMRIFCCLNCQGLFHFPNCQGIFHCQDCQGIITVSIVRECLLSKLLGHMFNSPNCQGILLGELGCGNFFCGMIHETVFYYMVMDTNR